MSVTAALNETYQNEPAGEEVIETIELDHITFSDPIRIATGVDDDAPGDFQLRSEPNPCVQRATLHFDLPAPGRVTLCLYDVNGRRVAMLLDGSRSAGRHEVTWRAADSDVPRGVYFARLQFDGRVATQRLLVLY